MTSMSPQRQALSAARAERAEILVAVVKQILLPADVIETATSRHHLALRRLDLRQLFLSAGAGTRGWLLLQSRLLRSLGHEAPANPLTVGWILDPRADGRRYLALQDAVRPRTEPWAGFPWTPCPRRDGGETPDRRSA